MPTMVMTEELARAIEHLKAGYRINKTKRRRWDARYLWVSDVRGGGHGVQLHEDFVGQLRALKLIEGYDLNPRETHFRYTKRVYRATEYCKNFNLPPEEFWVRERE